MFPLTASQSKQLFRRVTDLLLRRAARTACWAQQVLPGNRIQWHRGRLEDFAVKLEKRFVHVSTRLENLAGQSALLLDSSRQLLKYSLGHDDASTFQAAVAVMERPLDFNDECLGITDKLDRNLALVAVRIGRLHHFKSTLDASIAPLRILQTMFRIESAASSPEIQTLFTSLSAEIEGLLFRMSTMIAREFEAIERTGATVRDVIIRLAGIRTLQVKAQARRAEIGESLQKLEAQIETNKEKGKFVINFLISHHLISSVNHLNLEAALSGFGGGFTSQQTLIKLSRWSAILEYMLSESFKFPIILCNVNTMRKKVFGKARIKGIKAKDYVRQQIPLIVPNISKFEKVNRDGNWDKHNEDTFDAIVCSLFG